jgi:hypothetical protein
MMIFIGLDYNGMKVQNAAISPGGANADGAVGPIVGGDYGPYRQVSFLGASLLTLLSLPWGLTDCTFSLNEQKFIASTPRS